MTLNEKHCRKLQKSINAIPAERPLWKSSIQLALINGNENTFSG